MFTESIPQKYGMGEAQSVKTSASINSKSQKASEKREVVDQNQSAVRSLLYLTTRSEPLRLPSTMLLVLLQANEITLDYRKKSTLLSQRYNLPGYLKRVETEALTGYTDADWG